VDFLADDDFDDPTIKASIWTANETEVISKLNQIIKRTQEGQNRGPFDALKDFIANGNQLTLILGNHDVELALPQVRQYLKNVLGAQHGKLQFIYDGEAYVCGDLLIEHGNRYDSWNVVDHSALRQERSMLSRGLTVNEQERGKQYFLPPAGTLMVIHVINHLKKHYRFVDLLKPETGAVIPLLLALKVDYGILQDILSLSPLVTMRKIRGHFTAHRGNLKASRRSSPPTQNLLSDILQEMLGEDAALFIQSQPQRGNLSASRRQLPSLDTLLDKAQQIASRLLISAQQLEEQDNRKRLQVALKKLKTDFSFDIHQEKSNYLEAAKEIIDTGKFSHVVFGHTHLPKQIGLKTASGKNGQYLNTGTWADVMCLPAEIMEDNDAATKALTEFIEAMRNNDLSRYIKRYLSYVEVTLSDNKVTDAKLQNFCGIGAERKKALTEFKV